MLIFIFIFLLYVFFFRINNLNILNPDQNVIGDINIFHLFFYVCIS
jgi:hypothetical protein